MQTGDLLEGLCRAEQRNAAHHKPRPASPPLSGKTPFGCLTGKTCLITAAIITNKAFGTLSLTSVTNIPKKEKERREYYTNLELWLPRALCHLLYLTSLSPNIHVVRKWQINSPSTECFPTISINPLNTTNTEFDLTRIWITLFFLGFKQSENEKKKFVLCFFFTSSFQIYPCNWFNVRLRLRKILKCESNVCVGSLQDRDHEWIDLCTKHKTRGASWWVGSSNSGRKQKTVLGKVGAREQKQNHWS